MGSLLALTLVAAATGPVTFDAALASAGARPHVVAANEAAGLLGEALRALPGATDNPQFSVQPGWRMLAPENRGPEIVVGVSQPMSLAGLADRRREVVDGEQQVRVARAEALLLDARLEAAEAWLEAWARARMLGYAEEELATAREQLARLEAGARAQAFTSAEVAEAKVFVSLTRLRELDAEGALFEARVALAQAVGADASAPPPVAGRLPEWATPDEKETAGLVAHLPSLPTVRVVALQAALERSLAREVAAREGTRLQLGGLVQKEAPTDLLVFATAQLTFPIFDVGLRDRAPVQAESRALEGETERLTRQAGAQLVNAAHEVRHSAEVLEVLQKELLPAAQERVRLVSIQFDRGAVTLEERLIAVRNLADARAREVEARADHALARVRFRLLADAVSGANR